jgi:hypothetical protein
LIVVGCRFCASWVNTHTREILDRAAEIGYKTARVIGFEQVVGGMSYVIYPDRHWIRPFTDGTPKRMRAEANSPGRESKQSLVRYPSEAMRARIALLAKANGRSINAEIIDRLQKSMIGDTIANLEESVAELFDRIEKLESKVSDLNDQLNVRYDPK